MIDKETMVKFAIEAGIEVHDRKGHIRFGIDSLTGEDSSPKFEHFARLIMNEAMDMAAKHLDALEDSHTLNIWECKSPSIEVLSLKK